MKSTKLDSAGPLDLEVMPRAHIVVQPLPDGRKMKLLRALDERIGDASPKPWIVTAPEGALLYDREALEAAFAAGWRTAANWVDRDDLLSDVGSPTYIADRAKAIGGA